MTEHGFSTVELLLVIAIVAILAGGAALAFYTPKNVADLSAARDSAVSALEREYQSARTRGRSTTFTVAKDLPHTNLVEVNACDGPSGASLSSEITFVGGTGRVAGGGNQAITLRDQTGTRIAIVVAATGDVSVQHYVDGTWRSQ